MKLWRIKAEMTKLLYIDVRADTQEEAIVVAKNAEGSEFVNLPEGGMWLVDDLAVEVIEAYPNCLTHVEAFATEYLIRRPTSAPYKLVKMTVAAHDYGSCRSGLIEKLEVTKAVTQYIAAVG